MEKMIVTNSIAINAEMQTVWDALTNPEKTKLYMFGCKTVSDWKVNSPLLWRGEYEGKTMDFVSGYILDIQPYTLLKYSVIDPNATYAHTPENHLNITYELTEKAGQTTLTVSQDGFENAADGEKRYIDVSNNGDGWNPILIAIKQLIEQG